MYFFLNGSAIQCVQYGSIINLVGLTLERYVKVVHAIGSKKNLKRWMIHAAMAFAWIGGIVYVTPISFILSRVKNGFCTAYSESPASDYIYGGCNLIFFCFFPLFIFIYCYWRIVIVIRRQMRVMAGHSVEGSSQMTVSQAQSKRVKWNIIKTMIIVTVAFVLCWFPVNLYWLFLMFLVQSRTLVVGFYPAVFLVYVNVCMNPFIYALKHEGVKHQLPRLMVCRKPRAVGDTSGSNNSRAGGTLQVRTGVAHTVKNTVDKMVKPKRNI